MGGSCFLRRVIRNCRSIVRQPRDVMRRLILATLLSMAARAAADDAYPKVAPSSGGPPPGWASVSPPTTDQDWRCANYSPDEWRVETGPDDVVLISPAPRRGAITLETTGGRLIGTNHGEFGGTVEWQHSRSSRRSLIINDNPVAFVASEHGIILVAGLAHLGVRRGHLLKLSRSGDESWLASEVLDLGTAPNAAQLVEKDRLLIATTTGVALVDLRTMSKKVLYENPQWYLLYGGSIVQSKSGQIILGKRRAVVSLTAVDSTYREEWWVPSTCRTLRRSSGPLDPCECAGP